MTARRKIPEVACSLLEPTHSNPFYRVQVIICPYCGLSHIHGTGEVGHPPAKPSSFGHRVAHCFMPLFPHGAGYILKWDGQTRGDQRKAARRRR